MGGSGTRAGSGGDMVSGRGARGRKKTEEDAGSTERERSRRGKAAATGVKEGEGDKKNQGYLAVASAAEGGFGPRRGREKDGSIAQLVARLFCI